LGYVELLDVVLKGATLDENTRFKDAITHADDFKDINLSLVKKENLPPSLHVGWRLESDA